VLLLRAGVSDDDSDENVGGDVEDEFIATKDPAALQHSHRKPILGCASCSSGDLNQNAQHSATCIKVRWIIANDFWRSPTSKPHLPIMKSWMLHLPMSRAGCEFRT